MHLPPGHRPDPTTPEADTFSSSISIASQSATRSSHRPSHLLTCHGRVQHPELPASARPRCWPPETCHARAIPSLPIPGRRQDSSKVSPTATRRCRRPYPRCNPTPRFLFFILSPSPPLKSTASFPRDQETMTMAGYDGPPRSRHRASLPSFPATPPWPA